MQISKRLKAVVAGVSGNVLADIGTDHGYIAIESVRGARVSRAIACDINKGPLKRAENNISAYGLAESIQLRLGNGLRPIKRGEADCISIAGMGGMLMRDILREGADVLGAARLVLQPQLDIPQVRMFVHELGYRIANERMILEDKFYTVLVCERGHEPAYNAEEYEFGRELIRRKDDVLRQYLQKRADSLRKILQAHESAKVRGDLVLCEEVLLWM